MKRFGPPMIDRRLKRKQTRHEVERAAREEQDACPVGSDNQQCRCWVCSCGEHFNTLPELEEHAGTSGGLTHGDD